jgi:formyl-CoA transferase
MHGPLRGVRVIELGTLLAGSYGARLMAEMGAEVIKVEAPDKPDELREWGQGRYRGHTLWWSVQSRNKKCITLDLRTLTGQELLLKLIEKADIVIENFRPGTLEKWNLGYDRLRAIRPQLVLVRISGYGQTGAYSGRAGFAAAAEAMSGLRYINGYPGQVPPRLHISLGDSLGGMFGAIGALAALHRATETGHGQVVDVSLLEACFAMLESVVPEYDRLGLVRGPQGTGLRGIAPSNVFRTKDGKLMVIAANADGIFRRLCHAMGRPDLPDDPRFTTHAARGEHQEEIEGIVAEWAIERTAPQIDALLNGAGVVCAPIYSIADSFTDPYFRERGLLIEQQDDDLGTFTAPGLIPRFSETPGDVCWSGPLKTGVHNDEVLGGLVGLSADELRRLEEAGTI